MKHSKIRLFAVSALFCLAGSLTQAQPVNLLWIPLTNNTAGITALPSVTTLGGAAVSLTMQNSGGTATDLAGANGTGVNGASSGGAAMDLVQGTSQPAGGGTAADCAIDASDNNLGFGNITNFIVTLWVNLAASQGSSTIGPRLFVLSPGAGSGDSGDANTIGVKFQASGELYFGINTSGSLGTAQANNYPINKWLFFAWAYDGTNLYEYDGTDTSTVAQASKVPLAGQTVALGSTATLVLGNRASKSTRGLNGWMEDFRFYNGVFTNNLAFVEAIRKQIAPKIPTITGIYPDGTALMQATNTLTFTANSSDGQNLTNVDLKLNGVDVSTACTFVTNGAGSTNIAVTYVGLPQQMVNTAVMTATDAIGLAGSSSVTFDTFSATNFIVKAEEFDFNSGQFIDNPDYTNVAGDPNSYFGLDSVEGTDTHKGQSTGDNSATDYRYDDGTGLKTQTPLSTGELSSPTRFGGSVVPSHMVGNWSSAEWQNYTKTFPAGNYNVYARLSTSSGSTVTFSQVTSGQGTPNQALSQLGQFTLTGSGGFQWVPLRKFGTLAVVNLQGVNTVRATTGGGANADFYMLVPANNNLPVISSVYPDGQYLFEPTNSLKFTVSSSATTISTANIQLTLNGTNVSSSLTFSGGPSTWNVSYPGLQLNQSYSVLIQVTDGNGQTANATLNIDTWNPVMQIEAEDFDFDPTLSPKPDGTGLRFIDNPVPTPPNVAATNSYEGQVGDTYIDEQGNDLQNGLTPIQNNYAGATTANYRVDDPCATAPVTDTARRQFAQANALDYNVGFLGAGHWEQYTRTWPSGTYNVYARIASGANLGTLYSSWSQVIAGWGTTNEVTRHIGSFAIPSSGGYSSYFYTPLIDPYGNYAQLTLGGTNTFRDTHLVYNQTETANTAAYGLNINFYMLVAARTDLPRVDSIFPNGTVLMQGTNTFSFVASSPTYGINTTNIQVTLNGVNVSSNLVFSGSSSSWNVTYPGLTLDTGYTAVITITDNDEQTHSTTVNFDTFGATNFTWEAEDFDFDPANSPAPNGTGLRFIDNPVPSSVPATNSYFNQAGDLGTDYASAFLNDTITAVYRPNDFIPTEVTTDPVRQSYVNDEISEIDPYIRNYDIFNLTNGDWINYTRTFPSGPFYLYARVSAGLTPTNFQCALVTNGAGTSTQASNVLGNFQANGDAYASWQYAPLMSNGAPAVLNLGGVQTLQISGEGQEHVDFFMLVPVVTAPNRVLITASISGGNILMTFPTQTGHTYTMYYKNNLTDPTWSQVGTPVTGNGSTESVSDSLGHSQRFYQLIIQ